MSAEAPAQALTTSPPSVPSDGGVQRGSDDQDQSQLVAGVSRLELTEHQAGVDGSAGGGDDHEIDDEGLDRNAAIARDRQNIEEICLPHHIKAFSDDFCMLVCHRTAHRRLTLHVVFPPDYPNVPLHVEPQSDLLPPGVVGKLVDAALEKAKERLGRPQLESLYTFIDDIVQDNRLLFAMPEVGKLRQLAKDHAGLTVSVNELEGKVKVRATCNKYNLNANLIVPENYPEDQLDVEFIKCNFPETIAHVYLLQAREIARKLCLGVESKLALKQSTTMTGQPGVPPKALGPAPVEGLSTKDLKGLKNDVKFFKQATDLRAVNSGYNKQLHQYDHSTSVRRAARRELKKKSKEEAQKELAEIREAAERLEKEQMENYRRNVLGISGGPKRSLRVVGEFLVNEFIFRLPTEKSALSGRPVFPADPEALLKLMKKRSEKRPIRVPTCGCYFIYSELDEFLSTPPFLKPCPRKSCDGVVVQHPDWTSDVKKLEKAWAMKKAKEREIADVADMFGVDAEFTV